MTQVPPSSNSQVNSAPVVPTHASEHSVSPASTLEPERKGVRPKSGSRTRDHLANERTYLAWMRTAIALIGFGVLIARLRYLVSPDVPGTGQGWAVGLMLACIGLITVLLSTWHYFAVLRAIEEDTYEPNTRWVILFSLVVTLMGTGVLYVLFSVPASVKGNLAL